MKRCIGGGVGGGLLCKVVVYVLERPGEDDAVLVGCMPMRSHNAADRAAP